MFDQVTAGTNLKISIYKIKGGGIGEFKKSKDLDGSCAISSGFIANNTGENRYWDCPK